MRLTTVEEIADDVLLHLSKDEQDILRATPEHGIGGYHLSLGMAIRNRYGLWEDHPLTKNWIDNPEQRHYSHGCDCSPDHPDAVSNAILQQVWRKLQITH